MRLNNESCILEVIHNDHMAYKTFFKLISQLSGDDIQTTWNGLKSTWNNIKSCGELKSRPNCNLGVYFYIRRFETFINDYKRFTRFSYLVGQGNLFKEMSSFYQIPTSKKRMICINTLSPIVNFANISKLNFS
jgi:hypothetical protein